MRRETNFAKALGKMREHSLTYGRAFYRRGLAKLVTARRVAAKMAACGVEALARITDTRYALLLADSRFCQQRISRYLC